MRWVLIPGAGGVGWCWHLVEADLRDRGHDPVAPDFAARGRVGLPAYTAQTVAAAAGHDDVVTDVIAGVCAAHR